MRKLFAVILILTLLCGSGTVWAATPAGTSPLPGAINVLTNPDFEGTVTQSAPQGWSARHMDSQAAGETWVNHPFLAVDESVYHGDGGTGRSIRYSRTADASDVSTVYISQKVDTIFPNTRYRVGAWVRANQVLNADSKKVRFKVEYYTAEGKSNPINSDQYSSAISPSAANTWEFMTDVIKPPEGTAYLRLYCFFYPNAAADTTVWVDGLELIQIENEKKLELEADQYFYYPDTETGCAKARVFAEHTADLAGGTVDFRLLDTDKVTVLESRTNAALVDNMAFFSYPISHLEAKMKTPFYLEAKLKDSAGNMVDTTVREIHCYPRPGRLSGTGNMLNDDGSVFSPRLGYTTNSGNTLLVTEAKEMGMNLLCLSPGPPEMYYSSVKNDLDDPEKRAEKKEASLLKQWLDELAENNMKGLVALYQGMEAAAHPRNYEKTKAVVEDFKDHKALGGWVVMDEPFDMLTEPEYWLAESYKLIRNMDDKNPVYFVDNSLEVYKGSGYCDILAVDPYASYPKASTPIYEAYPTCGNNPASYSGEMTAWVRRTAEQYGKGLQVLNQAFRYNGYTPETSELRSFWYQAMLEGAHGAGWYQISGSDGILSLEAEGKRYQTFLKKFASEELIVARELFGRDSKYPLFNMFENERYAYKCVAKNCDLYIVVVNRKTETQTVQVPLLSRNGLVSVTGKPKELYLEGESVNPSVSGSTLTLTLPPANVSLIRIPCAVADASLLAQGCFDDISDSAHASAIEELYRADVLDSTGTRTFSPDAAITRGEAAKYLIRALDLNCLSSRGQMAADFSDVTEDKPYYREVCVGRSLGIFRGTGENLFNPDAVITGSEWAVLCQRALCAAMRYDAATDLGVDETASAVTRAEAAAVLQRMREF